MLEAGVEVKERVMKVKPLCPVFSQCGGCFFQDISYQDELDIKESFVKSLLKSGLNVPDSIFSSIVPSPKDYHYRHRVDLKLKKTKDKRILIGFSPMEGKGIVEVDSCFIADERVSCFIPELKKQAIKKLPEKYRMANLVVKTCDDNRVVWGGIGKKSVKQNQEEYLYAEVSGKRIYYSLDTFFQANLSILPKLIDEISQLPVWKDETYFYDLYGGVGLFAVCLKELSQKTYLIEENPASTRLAKYNKDYHRMNNLEIVEGKVEEKLQALLDVNPGKNHVVMIDPPRAGLKESVLRMLNDAHHLKTLLYLSCNPQALMRDLKELTKNRFSIRRIIPFDFFPKTNHAETLVWLTSDI